MIGNSADNQLKGGKGRDILFAGAGRQNRSIGGKGKDQFWIDSGAESFVKITDFKSGKDYLVFDEGINKESVDLRRHSKHTKIFVAGEQVGLVKNGQVDEQDVLFIDFSATLDPASLL